MSRSPIETFAREKGYAQFIMSQTVQIKLFDPSSMNVQWNPHNILVIGKRRTGKSSLALKLKQQVFNDCKKLLFRCKELWGEDMQGYEIFDKEIYEQIISDAAKQNSGTFIIMEIPLERTERKIFDKLFQISSSLNLNLMQLSPYDVGIHPNTRANFDFIFLFSGLEVNQLKRIYTDFASFVTSFDQFCKTYNETCRNFTCLVIDLRNSSTEVSDRIFHYKA